MDAVPTDQPVTIDPLASSSTGHSDLGKRDVVRAFAHIDNFWRRCDLSLYLVLSIIFGGNVGVLLFWICSSREGESSITLRTLYPSQYSALPVTIDPLASSSADHSDLRKRDVVRAFAHIDNFWRRFDLSLCKRPQCYAVV
ncbi:hypothetical protein B9479_002403 [Cryptococcus floricola]|uniref:Uncharacterized protein n=1 Tax=Cryptococcus floricola TaxID=2591691 RepID=A0A5D3AZQ3_9TREE|nr:hypothetical protein B9479_002403 [Cryptococcus floricola]